MDFLTILIIIQYYKIEKNLHGVVGSIPKQRSFTYILILEYPSSDCNFLVSLFEGSIFSEKTNPSKDYIRNLQSDDGYSDIRIYVDYSCYSSITNTCK